MKVDRGKAIKRKLDGETYCFCSEHCLRAFELKPDRYRRKGSVSDKTPAHLKQPEQG